jgi:hypothetical protein
MNARSQTTPIRRMLENDSGFALAVVMLMSAILFLLATSVLMLVTYRTNQTTASAERNQAMHVADAGINQYAYQLSKQYDYWKTHETLGPTAMDGGTWTVTRSTTPSGAVQLTSVGTLANGSSRTVKATVSFPNWAKYIVLVDQGPYSIGAGAVFDGDIRCNGNISNSGVIKGMAYAGGTCAYGTSYAVNYPGGHINGADPVDFTKLTNDFAAMKASAQNSGSYYAASGALGYNVVLNGPQATIYKVTNVETHASVATTNVPIGTLTQTLVGTAAIPGDGVFFFDDDVWVSGNYSAGVTIASSKTIWCPGNLVPTVSGANTTCGLVAQLEVLFPYWYETMPNDQIVQAALLSQTMGVGPDAPSGLKKWTWTKNVSTGVWSWVSSTYTPPYKNSVTLKGARAMKVMIGFSAGYTTRNFDKDPVLANNPPPLYPKLAGGGLKIDTWSEY